MSQSPAKVCVPVCAAKPEEMLTKTARAIQFSDLIEVRLDCLDRTGAAANLLRELSASHQRPLIFTMRSREQGGHNSLDYDGRRKFWSLAMNDAAEALLDLEYDLVSDFARKREEPPVRDWRRIICSHHDFERAPDELEQIYETMKATPAGILKIAVQARDATDCIPVFKLLARARDEGRKLIAIAMGPAGIMTRVLGPSRGSFLTYGSLDAESATAAGQVTAEDLRQLYRIDRLTPQTGVVGIIGKPVGHSLSPHIHNAAFAAAHVDAVYLPFEVSDAREFIRRMVHPRSREVDLRVLGLSVTAPHKSMVMETLDSIDSAAREMEAVNTIVTRGDELHGFNTDAAGFISPLRNRLASLQNLRCAIIGAGGGARAAVWALLNENAEVFVFARNPEKAKRATEKLGVRCRSLADASFAEFDLVVNATPLGTRGHLEAETPVMAENLRGVRLAYDLVYNPSETRFLREARAAGCDTLSGFEMLISQAIEQFQLWIGRQPDSEVMQAAALRRLSAS